MLTFNDIGISSQLDWKRICLLSFFRNQQTNAMLMRNSIRMISKLKFSHMTKNGVVRYCFTKCPIADFVGIRTAYSSAEQKRR